MNAHAHHLTRSQVIELLEERDTMREHIRQLEEALAPTVVLPVSWGLSTKLESLLSAIRAVGPNVLHRERAMIVLYGTWEDAPDQKIVDVMICKLRAKLFETGVRLEIETVFGRGWRMTSASCRRFDELTTADRAAWPESVSVKRYEARA